MRITFVSTMGSSPWGGSEELWSQAALRLLRQGHEVTVSVAWWPNISPKILQLEKLGAKIFLRRGTSHSFTQRLRQKVTNKPRAHQDITEWLRSQNSELIVISQGGNADGLDWMRICDQLNLPFAAVVQCNSETWWPRDKKAAMMARAYRAARRVFCVSRHNLELLERQIGEVLPNALVTWNPFNIATDKIPSWPKQNGTLKLACVARLEPAAKGQDLLFGVLAKTKWKQRPVQLDLYGGGPCEDTLKRLVGSLGLANVKFRGYSSDISEVWKNNNLLVLPSRCEGLPLALVEAMWCARPALVTDIGGNAEMCVDSETGFVAEAPNIDLLDLALERAWERRSEWERMGGAARLRAERLIPRDPVAQFCERLAECLSS